jgi:hypothetical protein
VDAVGPIARRAALSHHQEITDDATECKALMHGDDPGHGLALSHALKRGSMVGRRLRSARITSALKSSSAANRIIRQLR